MIADQGQIIALQDQLIDMLIVVATNMVSHKSAAELATSVSRPSSYQGEGVMPAQPTIHPRTRRRGAISSESIHAVLPSASITKVVVPKTAQQKQDLKDALQNSLLFSDIHDEDLNSLVEAFTPERCSSGTCIMRQGDNGDKFYIVAKGTCDVLISKDGGLPSTVYTVSDYGGFGELALMYDAPRAATVVSRCECELWSLDRRTFQTVLMVAITNRRRQYQNFLASVPILAKLTWEERAKIADVMEAKWFEDGEFIIEQGEEGDRIYFIEVGEASATKSFAPGQAARHVMSYSKGDYFGELALIRNEPRAANVVARGRCKVCAIDKPSFVRLLGPCLEIMNRQIDFYEMHECAEMDELTIDEFDLNEPLAHGQASSLPPPNKRRGAVSATPPIANGLHRHNVPSFPKSSGASGRLQAALRSIILFAHLEQDELDSVVDAFFEVKKKQGETIITQGEDGDNFYIVDAGECEVRITGEGGGRLVCVARQGDSFGELALMYNCPRAATVTARSDVVLFALSHEVFTLILRSSAQDRRAQYDSFLQRVPILQGLTAEERGKMADVLVQTSFKDGEVIIQERDTQANTFYIQFQGDTAAHAAARKSGHKEVRA
jgi:CRP-like cAMP-binding protein